MSRLLRFGSAKATSIVLVGFLTSHCGGTSSSSPAAAHSGGASASGATGGSLAASGGSSNGSAGNGASGGAPTTGGASSLTGGSAGSASTAGSAGNVTASGGESAMTGGAGSASTSGGTAGGASSSGGVNAGGEGGSEVEPPESPPPSCAGFTGTECAGNDCCESPLVPGGTVTVDGQDAELPSFRLDRYEVTVRRFRSFMQAKDAWALDGNPKEGAGAHPLVPASGYRRSWLTELDAWLGAGLTPGWRDFAFYADDTSTAIYGGNPVYLIEGTEELAVNYVPMHIAFAFCIWDGGRLPSLIEWRYAAFGGKERTKYPWGDSPDRVTMFEDAPKASVPTPYPDDGFWKYLGIPVGSHPASAGRFGHEDLAAGLDEYLRDTDTPGTLPTGGWVELADDQELLTDNRSTVQANWQTPGAIIDGGLDGVGIGWVGFRCARDLGH